MTSLNLYIHSKHLLEYLNRNIRRAKGNKYKTKGNTIPNKKLNKESFKKVICVF